MVRLATLHEPDHERLLRGVTGRMATYLQAYGDALVAMNGWDPAPLERFRADEVVQSVPGAIDAVGTIEQLEHIRTLIPEEWLPAAVGSAERVRRPGARPVRGGADGVILHGSAPAELEPVVQAYAGVRPAGPLRGPARQPRPLTATSRWRVGDLGSADDDAGREPGVEHRGPGPRPARALRRGAARGVRLPRCGGATDATVAEDLTAETFLAAVAAVQKGTVPTMTTAWLVGRGPAQARGPLAQAGARRAEPAGGRRRARRARTIRGTRTSTRPSPTRCSGGSARTIVRP